MMTTACYYILSNKDRVLPRLDEELKEAIPNPDARPDLKVVENLPWLVSLSLLVPF